MRGGNERETRIIARYGSMSKRSKRERERKRKKDDAR